MRSTALVALAALVLPLAACDDDDPVQPVLPNIVEVAQQAGNFNTLVTAIGAAGLTETLATGGPFTVFAPTDAAFAALPDGTVEALLEDPAALAQILTFHVVSGRFPAADVTGLSSVQTLNGQSLRVVVDGGTVRIGDANVVTTDIEAANGIIHVIDAVLLPTN